MSVKASGLQVPSLRVRLEIYLSEITYENSEGEGKGMRKGEPRALKDPKEVAGEKQWLV